MISTIIIFLIVLGVIVFLHEFGHFSMAKLFGVKVDEFGLGFPPKIIGRKYKDTEYTLNAIPLGGFVRIMGEDGANKNDVNSFASKPIWQKIIILSAGVVMNLLLAMVIFSIIIFAKFPQDITNIPEDQLPNNIESSYIQLNYIAEGGAASKSGLQVMDKVLSIDGVAIQTVDDFRDQVANKINTEVVFEIQRKNEVLMKNVLVEQGVGESEGRGVVGVQLGRVAIVKSSFTESIYEGVKHTIDLTLMTVEALWSMVVGSSSLEVSGPVGIVKMTGQAARLGILTLLNFMAIISINLAIINIIPFPGLDGGRILFLLIEKVKGSPLNAELEDKIHSLGFMILLLLMLLVTYRDLTKLAIWGKIMQLFG